MARDNLIFGGAVAALVAAAAISSIAIASRSETPPVKIAAPAAPAGPRLELTAEQLKQALASGALDLPVKSILNIAKPMQHGDFVWNDRGVPGGPVWVRIDLSSQLISVFRAGEEIGSAVILFGAEQKETPPGRFPVLWKHKDHRSATYDNAPMPYTLRLTQDGVSIHGSDVKWGAATHGCIGVPKAFARRLFEQVKVGDEVVIVDGSAPPKTAGRA